MKLIKQSKVDAAAENYGWRIKTNCFDIPVKANDLAGSAYIDFKMGVSYAEKELSNLAIEFANWILSKESDKGNFTITTIVDRSSGERKEINIWGYNRLGYGGLHTSEELFEIFLKERGNNENA